MFISTKLKIQGVIFTLVPSLLISCGEPVPVACAPDAEVCSEETQGGFETGTAAGIAAGAAAVLALAAGGTSGGGGGSGESSETGDTTSLKLINNSNIPIYILYVVPNTSSSWGNNQLSKNVEVGDSYTLSKIPCNRYYNLRIEGPNGATLNSLDQYLQCSQPHIWDIISKSSRSEVDSKKEKSILFEEEKN